MSTPRGESNKIKLAKLRETFDKKQNEYANLENKSTKKAETLLLSIEKVDKKIEELEPFEDVPHLSQTCKTHLADIYTAVKYGRKTENIKNKYIEKGLLLEEDAITMYSMLTSEFHKKNRERKNNGVIEGENDFFDDEFVIDTKVNWSIFQFNRTAAETINADYHWQLDGYMWLWNRPKAKLAYCLLNTPEHLIVAEEKKLLYDFVGTEEDYAEACKELRHNMIYDDMALEDKIRIFEVERNEERIEKIRSRVYECREYLNNFGATYIKIGDEANDEQE